MRNGKSVGHQRAYKTLGELVREYCGSHPQEWLANQLGVTSQFINMVIKNKGKFSKRTLCQFAALANIDIDLLAELTGYEITDLLRYFKPAYIMQTDIRSCIDQSETEISIAQLLRESGEPKRAKSSLFFTIDSLEKRIDLDKDNIKDIRDLKYVLIKAYGERMACNNDLMLRKKAVEAVFKDFLKLEKFALEINDSKGLAIGHTWLAGAYYVDNDYKKARENAIKALAYLNDDPSYLTETLRGLMIDHAKLKNPEGYKQYERKAIDALEKGIIKNPMDIASIYEAFGQSKTQLGDIDAIFKFQDARREARKINEYKKSRPIRYLQISRSELNFYLTIILKGITLDYKILADLAHKAENSTMALKDYERHRQEIKHLINCLKIPLSYRIKPEIERQPSLFY